MSTGALNILVVEDHRDSGIALAILLRRFGHAVQLATCCQKAVQFIQDKVFDIMLCDLWLPDGNGFDLLRDVKRRRLSIKAIAVSGCAMAEDVQQSQQAGFLAHIKKPYEINELQTVLKEVAAIDL